MQPSRWAAPGQAGSGGTRGQRSQVDGVAGDTYWSSFRKTPHTTVTVTQKSASSSVRACGRLWKYGRLLSGTLEGAPAHQRRPPPPRAHPGADARLRACAPRRPGPSGSRRAARGSTRSLLAFRAPHPARLALGSRAGPRHPGAVGGLWCCPTPATRATAAHEGRSARGLGPAPPPRDGHSGASAASLLCQRAGRGRRGGGLTGTCRRAACARRAPGSCRARWRRPGRRCR